MASALKNVARIGQLSLRRLAHSGPEKINPNLPEQTRKFKELQALYQKDDGIPVHLKRGARDKALYYLTWGLIAVGLEECSRFYYYMMFK